MICQYETLGDECRCDECIDSLAYQADLWYDEIKHGDREK
jgi:hypothetical protein